MHDFEMANKHIELSAQREVTHALLHDLDRHFGILCWKVQNEWN